MFSLLAPILVASFLTVDANPFLDVYLRVHPVDDFCGAQKCNLTYAISVLVAQNQFDLQSVMLQDGQMSRNSQLLFEDNTVIRLTRDLRDAVGKVYLGLMLFDMPDDIQDYVMVDVTDVIHKSRRAKVEFASETVRIGMHVYKRSESMISSDTDMVEKVEAVASEFDAAAYGVEEHKHPKQHGAPSASGCTCTHGSCACCRHLSVRKIHLDDVACVNISYAASDAGAKLSLSVDEHVYYTKEVSLKDPSAACFEVPHLREYASLCLKFYNMDLHTEALAGCIEVEAKLYHVKVARTKMGCFRVPL